MDKPVVLFGEGIGDEKFLKDFIKHHFGLTQVKYVNVDGKDSIHLVKNDFEMNTDQGGINLLIFDADSNYDKAYDNIIKQKNKIGVEFEIFLFPNNADVGALEELLRQLTIPKHEGIFDCFKVLDGCLTAKDGNYRVPDLKTQIFSYLSFQKLKSKEEVRDYTLDCWNLDAKYAKPLVEFLSPYFQ